MTRMPVQYSRSMLFYSAGNGGRSNDTGAMTSKGKAQASPGCAKWCDHLNVMEFPCSESDEEGWCRRGAQETAWRLLLQPKGPRQLGAGRAAGVTVKAGRYQVSDAAYSNAGTVDCR